LRAFQKSRSPISNIPSESGADADMYGDISVPI
jgi:hypothetical protein